MKIEFFPSDFRLTSSMPARSSSPETQTATSCSQAERAPNQAQPTADTRPGPEAELKRPRAGFRFELAALIDPRGLPARPQQC